jgi:putative membrane protein
MECEPGFDVHLFAKANAIINSCVALLLLSGLIAVKGKKYLLHKSIMLTAMSLSILFLVSYICHHLFAGEARFGDENHDGILSDIEKANAGTARFIYYFILGTHIPLAGIVLPFILFTAYRALIGEFDKHKKYSTYYLACLVLCSGNGSDCLLDDQPVLYLKINQIEYEVRNSMRLQTGHSYLQKCIYWDNQ